MLVSTRGIVLSHIRYKETSIIAKIFTEQYGLLSFVVNSVYKTKPQFAPAYFLPLTEHTLIIYYMQGRDINRVKELTLLQHIADSSIYKAALSMLIAEILGQSLVVGYTHARLYNYLHNTLTNLQYSQNRNIHLPILLQLLKVLGYEPGYEQLASIHNTDYDHQTLTCLQALLTLSKDSNIEDINIPNIYSKQILDMIMSFFEHHIPDFSAIKSINILREI
ncbi:MAG: DNA repair protein RecO [Cytophagales bacterium]|nr:DNA repair protein RecO [Cytophagales bacterium]